MKEASSSSTNNDSRNNNSEINLHKSYKFEEQKEEKEKLYITSSEWVYKKEDEVFWFSYKFL